MAYAAQRDRQFNATLGLMEIAVLQVNLLVATLRPFIKSPLFAAEGIDRSWFWIHDG
jgi:hypothetical protein